MKKNLFTHRPVCRNFSEGRDFNEVASAGRSFIGVGHLILVLILICTIEASAQVPSWLWATSPGGTSSSEARGNATSTDAGGNVLVTGRFNSPSITFGSTTLTNGGDFDFFVVKYSPSGNVEWATSAGGLAHDEGSGISTDANGNVFVTGYFDSPSITFGTTTLNNAGVRDIFVVKYDSSGNVLWATSAGGTGSDAGYGITTDASGNVLVTGSFAIPSITFGNTTLTNAGSLDIFVVKYDASGNVLWATRAGGTSSDVGIGISSDAGGNVAITGYFYSPSITFGNTTLTNASVGQPDIFVVKYDTSGNMVWASSAGGTGMDLGIGVSTDAGGNVILTGWFSGSSITFGNSTLISAGSLDIFVAKYDASGNVLWAISAGGTDEEEGGAISTDAAGNVVVTGFFYSPSITFSNITLTSAGLADIFIVKYDASGNVLWATSAGGTDDDDCRGISTDAGGNVFVTGIFYSPSITFGSTTLTNTGFIHMFVAKLDNITGIEEKIKNDEVRIFPNPFSPDASESTTISFTFSKTQNVSIKIFDITGRLVNILADEEMQEGNHRLEWNARDEKGNAVGTGIYFLRVESENYSETKKISLMK
ncbi:MAG: T9SS type A sorting domain-containing protein [Bacteroidota bacterium]